MCSGTFFVDFDVAENDAVGRFYARKIKGNGR